MERYVLPHHVLSFGTKVDVDLLQRKVRGVSHIDVDLLQRKERGVSHIRSYVE